MEHEHITLHTMSTTEVTVYCQCGWEWTGHQDHQAATIHAHTHQPLI